MRKSLFAVTLLAFSVAGTTACATKGYVKNSVGQVSNKVDTLSTALEETQERTRKNEARIGEVDTKAGAAQTAASTAQTAANTSRRMTRKRPAKEPQPSRRPAAASCMRSC
jgi:hypothetical protein